LNPVRLPQGQFAGSGSDFNYRLHQGLHPAQLPAEQPLQDEPADEDTVSPPPPLLTNPHEDISLVTFLLLQVVHSGLSDPMIKHSKSLSHLSQWYS
jgi:hypothetical protein